METSTGGESSGAADESHLVRAALHEEYEILEELGRGGMAVVFRARERALDREVAIKVLPLARTYDAEFVERFQREARLSASLEHPHIVPIYRVGQSGRVNYFVMKYIRGQSLKTALDDAGSLEPAEVEKVLSEVGDALDYAHGQGVIHRDVKPDNIMRDQTGRYVVMDFGIARSVHGTQLTQGGASIGTPRYMSPEQARGSEVGGASDFYSLGVVGYQSLVGRPPFGGDDPLATLYSHLHDPVPDPALESPEALRVYAGIERLLAKSVEDRAGTSGELAAAMADPGDPGGRSVPGSSGLRVGGVRSWLGNRTARTWAPVGLALAVTSFFVFRGGASADCREALSGASQDERALLVEPIGTIERGAPIELSYIACGFASAEPLSGRVVVRPADTGGVVGRVGRFLGGGDDPVRLTWDDEADGYATRRIKSVATGDLEAGAYRIIVTIQGRDGSAEEADHEFTVLGGDGG